MSSGRRPKIMIACVTFETVKVADPVDYYEANKVYLIHYTSEKSSIYGEFYDQTVKLIREKCGSKVEIVERHEIVWQFADMLRTVVGIIDTENAVNKGECDIFVNISAGSPEYSAAAAIASMMYENTTPFAVSTDKYTIESDEEIRKSYFREVTGEDGKTVTVPIGLSLSVKEPVRLAHYYIKKPQESLVRGLRIYKELLGNGSRPRRVTAPQVIERLTELGFWEHTADTISKKKNEKASNAVYFHREYIERWLKHKWIKRDESGKRYVLTDEGNRVIETFYTEG